ncbi:MAG: hypothetical protein ACD_62C00658G0007 [uncultured bacterium]|nr:MAG: hypothetical protein ACD_62C00658G0007 [uncultured bacterium]HLD46058.1 nucleotidyl transferase AbiEii/AbiGii toxin family protein [bacterium]
MNTETVKKVLRGIRRIVEQNEKLSINEVRIIVALERAIARLIHDRVLQKHLIFKGGFVLLKNYDSSRFTRDVDALALAISKEKISELVGEVLSVDLDDGLWFGDLKVNELTEAGQYGAYRFGFAFQIGEPEQKKIHNLARLHIDIGFSDRVSGIHADSKMIPILKGDPPLCWNIYPLEYIVAEKLHTLIQRGSANSRAKDIFDLVHLIPKCVDKKALVAAVQNVFDHRKAPLPKSFAETIVGIDNVFLTQGWPSVKTLASKPSFEETWQSLITFLAGVDGTMISYRS